MSLLESYRQRLEAQIREHKTQLDALKEKAKRFARESQEVGRAELAVADKQFGQVKSKLNELKGTSGSAFEEIKAGVKRALLDLQVSTKRAAHHFQNAPAAASTASTSSNASTSASGSKPPSRAARVVRHRVAAHAKMKSKVKAKITRTAHKAKAAVSHAKTKASRVKAQVKSKIRSKVKAASRKR
jgi:hypothetical protein